MMEENFVDELRNYDEAEERQKLLNEEKQNMLVEVNREVPFYINLIKQACIKANKQYENSTSFYVTETYSDGYSDRDTIEKLPTVEQYEKAADEFNKAKYLQGSKCHYASSSNYETRLYGNLHYYNLDQLNYIKMLKTRLNKELKKMGFQNFTIEIQALNDTYIIHNRSVGFFSSVVSEHISTRTKSKLYVLHFKLKW